MDVVRIGNKIIVPGRFEVTTTQFDVLKAACMLEAHIRELKQMCEEGKAQRSIQTKRFEDLDRELTDLRVQEKRQKAATARLEKILRELRVKNGLEIPITGETVWAVLGGADDSFAAENLLRLAFTGDDTTVTSKHASNTIGSDASAPKKSSANSRNVLTDLTLLNGRKRVAIDLGSVTKEESSSIAIRRSKRPKVVRESYELLTDESEPTTRKGRKFKGANTKANWFAKKRLRTRA
jgi:hypothetical protein